MAGCALPPHNAIEELDLVAGDRKIFDALKKVLVLQGSDGALRGLARLDDGSLPHGLRGLGDRLNG